MILKLLLLLLLLWWWWWWWWWFWWFSFFHHRLMRHHVVGPSRTFVSQRTYEYIVVITQYYFTTIFCSSSLWLYTLSFSMVRASFTYLINWSYSRWRTSGNDTGNRFFPGTGSRPKVVRFLAPQRIERWKKKGPLKDPPAKRKSVKGWWSLHINAWSIIACCWLWLCQCHIFILVFCFSGWNPWPRLPPFGSGVACDLSQGKDWSEVSTAAVWQWPNVKPLPLKLGRGSKHFGKKISIGMLPSSKRTSSSGET